VAAILEPGAYYWITVSNRNRQATGEVQMEMAKAVCFGGLVDDYINDCWVKFSIANLQIPPPS
jgi:hypothetical protein